MCEVGKMTQDVGMVQKYCGYHSYFVWSFWGDFIMHLFLALFHLS